MLRYLYFIFCLSSYLQVIAQDEINHDLKFTHYTIDQGLSQASINDLVLDKSGYLWIATQDGLNRFDGSSFLVFQHDEKNKELCGNFINTLLLDEGKIWIGTRSSGLCYYSIDKKKFHNLNYLRQKDIISLKKDSFNNIYATLYNNRIALIRKNSDDTEYNIKEISIPGDNKQSTAGLCITPSGRVWVGTKEGRLFYAATNNNPDKIVFTEYSLNQENIGVINVINSNKAGEIWIGTRHALFKLNVRNNILTRYNLSVRNHSPQLIIYDIKWKGDEMWVATGSGLYIVKNYLSKTRAVSLYKHKELNANSLSNNTATNILFDNDGQGWVGTGKYLNLLYKDPIVNVIKSEVGNKNSLNSNVIFSIQKQKEGLWVGTSGGGLNLIRENSFYNFTKESNHLPSNVVFSTTKDNDGNLWIGTKEGLSIIYSSNLPPNKIKFNNLYHSPENNYSLSNNFIRQIYSDKSGNIWICTYNGGLNRFTGDITKKQFDFLVYRHLNSDTASIPADRVYCIRQTGNNEYWIGTINGLAILTFVNDNYKTPRFRRLKVKGSSVLTNSVIYDIMEADNHDIWLGTRTGLYKFDRMNKKLLHYNEENGMPNNVVYGILEDNDGKIWISTNNGISSFNRQTNQFTNYSTEDGFADREFNLQARFKDSDGVLYFGGINGISLFNPGRVSELDKKNRLYFNSVLVTNYQTNQLEKLNFDNTKPLKLKSSRFPFYVNFSNINLKYHKNTQFAYRLKPDDKTWNFIGKDRQIQFLKLSPGNYILEIQGVSRNRVWEDIDSLKMPISIIPPWWKSLQAYIMYLILFLTIVFYIHKFYLNKKLEYQERLRLVEIDEMKTTFYTNITHELRTPLSVILGVSEDIDENLDDIEKNKYGKKLSVLMRNSKKLLRLINQILDLSKIENNKLELNPTCDNIVHFLKIITESFHSLAKHKDIEFVYYSEIDNLCMDFDRDKFLIIISNLLSNAIKFTPINGKVILHVRSEKDSAGKELLVIKVKDTGIGIDKDDLENIFDRFFQAKKSNSNISEGTGIGLAIVKEYIGLMSGTVNAESTPGKGTVFTLQIPVTRNARKIVDKTEITIDHEQELQLAGSNTPADLNTPLLLIVEDNYDVANYIASCIDEQYSIIFASDGEEGINKAVEFVPDLIVTDLMMPKRDGFELCETLKNSPATSHVPIIMLTARSLEQDKLKGYSAGADAYLIKPFNKKELLIRIEKLTELRRKLHEKYSGSVNKSDKPITVEDKFLNKLISLIDKNIDDTQYKSANLAADMNFSESQLYRKVKALTNNSTALYIRNYRLEKAKEMLQTTDMNISEIAYLCGFNDPAWFTHAFKEKFKVSPSRLRKS